MKKLIIVICFFILISPSYAKKLKGNVIFTQETIETKRLEDLSTYQYRNLQKEIDFDKTLTIQEFNANLFKFVNIKTLGVIYKTEPNVMYFYYKTSKGYKCLFIGILSIEEDCKKAIIYDSQTGEIISVVINVSNKNYIYNKKGKLIGHWIGEQAKIFNKNLKMERVIIE